MKTESQTKRQTANQNLQEISVAKLKQLSHERLCWSMMRECSQVINLSYADIIEIHGSGIGAHTAMLARQFETLMFEYTKNIDFSDICRVLWLTPDADMGVARESAKFCDIIIVCHAAEDAKNTIDNFAGFARIAARRNIGNNTSLSIFGKNLLRDVFKPKVRCELAA